MREKRKPRKARLSDLLFADPGEENTTEVSQKVNIDNDGEVELSEIEQLRAENESLKRKNAQLTLKSSHNLQQELREKNQLIDEMTPYIDQLEAKLASPIDGISDDHLTFLKGKIDEKELELEKLESKADYYNLQFNIIEAQAAEEEN